MVFSSCVMVAEPFRERLSARVLAQYKIRRWVYFV
jgi:hypothetical protein